MSEQSLSSFNSRRNPRKADSDKQLLSSLEPPRSSISSSAGLDNNNDNTISGNNQKPSARTIAQAPIPLREQISSEYFDTKPPSIEFQATQGHNNQHSKQEKSMADTIAHRKEGYIPASAAANNNNDSRNDNQNYRVTKRARPAGGTSAAASRVKKFDTSSKQISTVKTTEPEPLESAASVVPAADAAHTTKSSYTIPNKKGYATTTRRKNNRGSSPTSNSERMSGSTNNNDASNVTYTITKKNPPPKSAAATTTTTTNSLSTNDETTEASAQQPIKSSSASYHNLPSKPGYAPRSQKHQRYDTGQVKVSKKSPPTYNTSKIPSEMHSDLDTLIEPEPAKTANATGAASSTAGTSATDFVVPKKAGYAPAKQSHRRATAKKHNGNEELQSDQYLVNKRPTAKTDLSRKISAAQTTEPESFSSTTSQVNNDQGSNSIQVSLRTSKDGYVPSSARESGRSRHAEVNNDANEKHSATNILPGPLVVQSSQTMGPDVKFGQIEPAISRVQGYDQSPPSPQQRLGAVPTDARIDTIYTQKGGGGLLPGEKVMVGTTTDHIAHAAPHDNTAPFSEPGAYGVAPIGAEGQDGTTTPNNEDDNYYDQTPREESNQLFEVEATLVNHDTDHPDYDDIEENVRKQILHNAVEANVVDTDKEQKERMCRFGCAFCCLIVLVIGLSVGLTQRPDTFVTFAPTSTAPTFTPSAAPTFAPTEFSIVQCSTYTDVDDIGLYQSNWDSLLERLAEFGEVLDLSSMEICAPQAMSSFRLAILQVEKNQRVSDERLVTLYALGVIFFATGGEDWSDNDRWMETYGCEWAGLNCLAGPRLVTLALNGNNLVGTIPSEIGLLSLLEEIRIMNNELEGSLPTWIGLLSNMRSMEFSGNSFTGAIPSEFGNMSVLTNLEMRSNNFSGQIPASLGNATSLESLGLERNSLNGTIPSTLGQLKEAVTINLGANGLSGNIPGEIGRLSRLEVFECDSNTLSGRIPSELFQLERLEELELSGNMLSGQLPTELNGLRRLKTLLLDDNNLDGSLPTEIGLLGELEELNLDENSIGNTIPTEIGRMVRLERLDLLGNQLIGFIPTEFGLLTRLSRLSLARNNLMGFPTQVSKLSNLGALIIGENPLRVSIPTEIGLLKSLTMFEASRSNLIGTIPSEIANLELLETFVAGSNDLTGTLPVSLPKFILALALDRNNLFGTLPSNWTLIQIGVLNLSQNELTGTLPTEYGSFTLLDIFSLSDNAQLTGTVPSEFGMLESLIELRLGGTGITGIVPDEICNLSNFALEVLEADTNMLECQCCDDPQPSQDMPPPPRY